MKMKLFITIFLISNFTISCSIYYKVVYSGRSHKLAEEFSNKLQNYHIIFDKLRDSLKKQNNDYLIFEVASSEYQLSQGNATAFFFVRENGSTKIQKLDLSKKYPNNILTLNDIFTEIIPLFNCLSLDSINVGLQPCLYYTIIVRFENKHKEIITCGMRNNECIDNVIDYLRDYLFAYEMTGYWEFIDDPNILYGK